MLIIYAIKSIIPYIKCIFNTTCTWRSTAIEFIFDEYERKRDEKLAKTIDNLHMKYGKGIVSKAISYTDSGTKHGRLGLMAGHKM